MEFVYEFDNIGRQLDLLRDANRRLQDTNDGLRNLVDVNRDSLLAPFWVSDVGGILPAFIEVLINGSYHVP